ncbi:MAG TPA: MraY family glycosyltransferase [Syntrophobacteraceae bacterium]|nr:MraY family glycosyltransferase [Syntrophobacteraceae bacterium]
MIKLILIAACAFFTVVLVMPLVKRTALRWGFVDEPGPRKLHLRPLPRLGGVAVYLGCMAALAVFDLFYLSQLVSILLGATFVSFLGIWDDYRVLGPVAKLSGQVCAAVILLLSGVQVTFLPHPVLNVAVTIFWVVSITNALNLLDNMDGLSAGTATVACAFFLLLAVMNKQFLVGSLAAALLGACVGFLLYNFNPAGIFMGDSGSLFIGFVLAAIGIKLRFPDNVAVVTWMIPVVVLGVPIFDTTLVVVSRLRRGLNPIVSPGKDHLSHRLLQLGCTQREAVLVLYLLCGALGVLSVVLMHATRTEGFVIGALLALAGLWALWRLEKVPVS